MHIHLFQNQSIKGRALLAQLRDQGYIVDCGDLTKKESQRVLKNKNPLLIIIDVECLSEFTRLEIQHLCNERNRVVLLGAFKKFYLLFDFPCQTMGYICRNDRVRNLYNAIVKLGGDESYISESASAFLELSVLKQQQQLLGGELPKPFTSRELRILREIAEGKKTRQIAVDLFRSINTIKNHRKNISRKLYFKKDLRLMKFCIDHSEAIQTLIALNNHKSRIKQLVEK